MRQRTHPNIRWGFQIVCLHTRARYHKSEIWKWNKCTLSCIFDIWSLKLETIANKYRRSHRPTPLPPSLLRTHNSPALSVPIPIRLCASLFGLSACLPAWWTWRTCRQHVPHLSVPVCVLSMCTCACVYIPVTNTCVNLITTNWPGRKRGSTEAEWPSRTPNKWDITNLYWMPLMT